MTNKFLRGLFLALTFIVASSPFYGQTPVFTNSGTIQSYPTSDLICAKGNDTTIAALTVTGATNVASPVFTVSASPLTAGYLNGQTVKVAGVVDAGADSNYNGIYTLAATPSSTTLTATCVSGGCVSPPGSAYSSGGTISMPCTNSSDALTTSLQSFATTLTVPAITSAVQYFIRTQYGTYTTATAPALALPGLVYNTTQLTGATNNGTLRAGNNSVSASVTYTLSGSASLLFGSIDATSMTVAPQSSSAAVFNITTSSAQPLSIKTGFVASGLASGTYTSGITATGTVGQTCTLTAFNNSNSGGTATVALTGTNTIAGGTALVITNTGFASASASTSATAGNGTATCSGTATVSTVLGGAQGNALRLLSFAATKQQ